MNGLACALGVTGVPRRGFEGELAGAGEGLWAAVHFECVEKWGGLTQSGRTTWERHKDCRGDDEPS